LPSSGPFRPPTNRQFDPAAELFEAGCARSRLTRFGPGATVFFLASAEHEPHRRLPPCSTRRATASSTATTLPGLHLHLLAEKRFLLPLAPFRVFGPIFPRTFLEHLLARLVFFPGGSFCLTTELHWPAPDPRFLPARAHLLSRTAAARVSSRGCSPFGRADDLGRREYRGPCPAGGERCSVPVELVRPFPARDRRGGDLSQVVSPGFRSR